MKIFNIFNEGGDYMLDFINKFNYTYIGNTNYTWNHYKVFYYFDQNISEIFLFLNKQIFKQTINGISKKIFSPKIELKNNYLYFIDNLDRCGIPEACITPLEQNKKEIIDLIGIIANFLNLKEASIFFKYFDYNDKLELKEKNLLDKLLIYLDIGEIIIKFNYYTTNIVSSEFDFGKVIRLPDVYDNLQDFQQKIYSKEKLNLEYFSEAFIKKYIL